MAWVNTVFNAPAVITDAVSDVDSELTAQHIAMGNVRSAALASLAIDAPDAGVTSHTGPITGRAALHDCLTPSLRAVIVHPWCEGLAQGVGHYRHLSVRNAVNAAAKKLGDVIDQQRPTGAMDILALLVAGSSYAELHQKLQYFLTVFSNPTLYMCARRCAQLASIETDKILLPDAAMNAGFHHFSISHQHAIANTLGDVGMLVALGDAATIAGNSAETDLIALTKKKEAIITAAKTTAENAIVSFSGGAGRFLFLSGTTANAASRALIDSDVGYEYPLAVCAVVAGAPGELGVLRSMLQ